MSHRSGQPAGAVRTISFSGQTLPRATRRARRACRTRAEVWSTLGAASKPAPCLLAPWPPNAGLPLQMHVWSHAYLPLNWFHFPELSCARGGTAVGLTTCHAAAHGRRALCRLSSARP